METAERERSIYRVTIKGSIVNTVLMVFKFVVGAMILVGSAEKIIDFARGIPLEAPGYIAFIAAIVSILLKEWTYQFTVREGRKLNSQAVIANAWHHRSDAFSSIGTAIGVGGAVFLGNKWAVLDPIAAVIVSISVE